MESKAIRYTAAAMMAAFIVGVGTVGTWTMFHGLDGAREVVQSVNNPLPDETADVAPAADTVTATSSNWDHPMVSFTQSGPNVGFYNLAPYAGEYSCRVTLLPYTDAPNREFLVSRAVTEDYHAAVLPGQQLRTDCQIQP